MENVILEYDMEEIYCNLLYMAVRKSEQYFIIKVYAKSSIECVHDFYIKNDDMDKLVEELVKVRDDVNGKVVINDSETDSYIIFEVVNNSASAEINISNNKSIKYVKMSDFIGYEPFKTACNLIKSSWKYGEVTDNYDFEIRNVVEGEGVYVKVEFAGNRVFLEPYDYMDISTYVTVTGIVSFQKTIDVWWEGLNDTYNNLVSFIKKNIQSCSLCSVYGISEIKFIRNRDDSINMELDVGENYVEDECKISVVVDEAFVLELSDSIGEFVEQCEKYRIEKI